MKLNNKNHVNYIFPLKLTICILIYILYCDCVNGPLRVSMPASSSILQPFIKDSISFIKDSQNLIQNLESKKFSNDIKLCSFDFESLYSNIDLSDALSVIKDFMIDKISNSNFNFIGFIQILKLVFEN